MTRKITHIFALHSTQQAIVAWIVLGFIILAIAFFQLFNGLSEDDKHLDSRFLFKKFAVKVMGAIVVMMIPTILIVLSVMEGK